MDSIANNAKERAAKTKAVAFFLCRELPRAVRLDWLREYAELLKQREIKTVLDEAVRLLEEQEETK